MNVLEWPIQRYRRACPYPRRDLKWIFEEKIRHERKRAFNDDRTERNSLMRWDFYSSAMHRARAVSSVKTSEQRLFIFSSLICNTR